MTRTWAHPRDVSGFACQWRTEVEAAQALGARVGPGRYLEVRYERLVAAPVEAVQDVCAFAGLAYEPAMLDYAGTVDLSGKPHQRRLAQPPTVGVRDWRTELAPADVAAFEEIAGDLLVRLGYEVQGAARPRRLGRVAGCSPTGSASAPSKRLRPRSSGRPSGVAATPSSASQP